MQKTTPTVNKDEITAEKLEEVATSLKERATDKLNQDRKTNTARRARMASGVEEDARKDIFLADTMLEIADAIKSGRANWLNRFSTMAGVKQLSSIIFYAHLDRAKAGMEEGPTLNEAYDKYERLRKEPISQEVVPFVKYPYPELHKDIARSLAYNLQSTKGMKMLGKSLEALAISARNHLVRFSGHKDLELIQKIYTKGKNIPAVNRSHNFERLKNELADYARMRRMDIYTVEELRQAVIEFLEIRGGVNQLKADPVVMKMRDLEKRKKVLGREYNYFPTPPAVVREMMNVAQLEPGMKVLEPSAGSGYIADAILAKGISKNDLTLVELSPDLIEVLNLKGYQVVQQDFLKYQGGPFDRILMNPPFSNRQDVKHVRHAFSLLKPSGRLVAITSEGPFYRSQRPDEEFREFVDENGYSQKLPEGSFKDSDNQTGVNTRIVVLDKPANLSGLSGFRLNRPANLTMAGLGRIYPQKVKGSKLRQCADNTWSSAGRGACSRHGGLKESYRCPEGSRMAAFAYWLQVDEIQTDEDRFQNREADYSEESVQRMVDNYDLNLLDPVVVWKDPANDRTYMLSGHSRLAAHRQLGKERIPARYFQGTEEQAIVFARLYANRLATPETLIETLNIYRQARDQYRWPKEKLKEKFGREYNRLESYSYLDPTGKWLQIINTPARKSFPYVETKAAWVGILRIQEPRLTNFHEGELWAWLMEHPRGSKQSKDEFLAHFSQIVNRLDWDPAKPLNLERSSNRGVNARADTGPAQKRIREIEKSLAENRSRIRMASTQEEKRAISRDTKRLLEEKEQIERSISNMVKSQTSLFGLLGIR